jgi:DNA helicase II / ATP-dependent DNA helicase PcrA
MRYIGDFHIHSHYSRATSKALTPENLDLWGRKKGISVIGTGDFTHPVWIDELQEKLEPAEEGLFIVKKAHRIDHDTGSSASDTTRFLLTAEISSIYKYKGKIRKVHNIVFAPDFAAVVRIQKKIEKLGGNIRSDGRPILGLDSHDLLELCLEADNSIFFVPAHIWTPWFSVLGARSGFDSITECFRDLSDHIFAVETGLSSDPPMNWMCSFLDRYTLISNSDAHSPEKLGREACLFDTDFSYSEIIDAMKRGTTAGFRGTVEFFPQEGKYHYDGHRKCNVVWNPLKTLEHGAICPVCGSPVTVGVLNRVAQLADRKDLNERQVRDPFYSLIPLKELISELEGVGVASKRVEERYANCLNRLGPELDILLSLDISDIEQTIGEDLAVAIERMRNRQVHVHAGYDGEYGSVRIWGPEDPPPSSKRSRTTPTLFSDSNAAAPFCTKTRNNRNTAPSPLKLVEFDLARYQEQKQLAVSEVLPTNASVTENNHAKIEDRSGAIPGLNREQEEAASYTGGPSLIIAGPGTGKTRTVVEKIVQLVQDGMMSETIVAITFANKAANELRERLLGAGVDKVDVFTFHSLGLSLLKPHLSLLGRDENVLIIDDEEKIALLKAEKLNSNERGKEQIEFVSRIKSGIIPMPDEGSNDFVFFRHYQDMLKRHNCFDFDDLVYLPVRLFKKHPALLTDIRRYRHLIIDEYQDINPTQYKLVRLLAEEAELCAVGDPHQSIYGFRGSSPEFIKHFSQDFPQAKIFSLTRSYRCPGTILKASSQVLGTGNPLAGLHPGLKINITKTPTAAFEAEQIARTIETQTGGMGFFSFDSEVIQSTESSNVALSDIAVLCRTSMQMPFLEKAFMDHRIPYRAIHTDSLFAKEPFRTFLNVIRLLLRNNSLSHTLITTLKNIDLNKLKTLPLPQTRKEAIALFADLYCTDQNDADIRELIDTMESEIILYWGDTEDALTFVENARLGSGIDRYDPRMQTVSIMTIHAAKGLEFDIVYIPGCEESLMPYTLSGTNEVDIEEEKRLLYVAMTRAKQHLIFTHAQTRVIFGKKREQTASPFLLAIEEALLNRQEIESDRKAQKLVQQLSLFD